MQDRRSCRDKGQSIENVSKIGPDLTRQTVQIKVQNERKKVNDKRGPVKTKDLILSVKRHEY